MTNPQDANSIIMGTGAPAAKFETIGATISGVITSEPEARQQTDFRTQTPEVWKDGSPKMQVIVLLATALRDPERPHDDGERALYIKGKHLTDAIRKAVRATGAKGLHTGGTLTVQYVADGPAEPGLNPPKLYAASYTPPAVSFAGVTAPTGAAPQPVYAQPIQQAAPVAVAQPVQHQAAVVASVTPSTSDTPPPNVDPAQWAKLGPDQRAQVLALMAPQPAY